MANARRPNETYILLTGVGGFALSDVEYTLKEIHDGTVLKSFFSDRHGKWLCLISDVCVENWKANELFVLQNFNQNIKPNHMWPPTTKWGISRSQRFWVNG